MSSNSLTGDTPARWVASGNSPTRNNSAKQVDAASHHPHVKDKSMISTKPRLLSESEAATYLGISRISLRKARCYGEIPGRIPPPPVIRLGRTVRYDVRDLDAFIENHRVSTTSALCD